MTESDTMTLCPFEWDGELHVSRWDGKNTDGPDSDFRRIEIETGDMLIAKPGARIDRSSLLNEEIMFGKHKGNKWRNVPTDYLQWLVKNGRGKWRKIGKIAADVIEARRHGQ